MPKPVPTPLAAALGLVPTVLDRARRLPVKAVQFPVLAVASALTALDGARREYDELADRGARLVAQMRGLSFDEEDQLDDARSTRPEPVETAAIPEVVDTARRVTSSVSAPEITDRSELPLADYDHMTIGSLRGRLRSLSVPELVQLRDYEKAHAHRLPVVTLLDNRLAKLATDEAVTPPATP